MTVSYRVWRSPEVIDVKRMAEERMKIFDSLPKHLQDYANQHGLNRAIKKLEYEQAIRS